MSALMKNMVFHLSHGITSNVSAALPREIDEGSLLELLPAAPLDEVAVEALRRPRVRVAVHARRERLRAATPYSADCH